VRLVFVCTLPSVGAPGAFGGIVDGVTDSEEDFTEAPNTLLATTETRYDFPFVRPVTVIDVEGAFTVLVRGPLLKSKVTR
jgi:hypothetical protein